MVTALHRVFRERSRQGMMEGLRNKKVDNHCALEVSHLKKGTRSFEVRRPKCEEGRPETLRAEEVGFQKSCINVDHVA